MRTPATYEELRAALSARYPELSKRLQQIAAYALAQPNDMALETISVIAQRAQVQPSSLIRFAKGFGFDGFTEMQRLFRTRLVGQAPNYNDRIKALQARHGAGALDTPQAALDEFVSSGIEALEHLRRDTRARDLERAVKLLAEADMVHLAAQRRSFPVAAYLAYGLGQLGRRFCLLDSVGGMIMEQARAMAKSDLLFVVSFRNYAPEVMKVAEQAKARGVPILAITDSPLSPLVPLATVCLEAHEAELEKFRSLAAPLCLALTLVVSLGQHLQSAKPARRSPRRARR